MQQLLNSIDLSKVQKPITYAVALKRKPKEGNAYTITDVKWSKQAENDARDVIALETVGNIEIFNKKKLLLPKGYKMVWHPSEEALRSRIYEKDKQCSSEYLDKVCRDFDKLGDYDINLDYIDGDHPEWTALIDSREESWDAFFSHLKELKEEFRPEYKHDTFAPPSIIPVLEKMLAVAKERNW